jgi:hypothetical protein
MNTTIKDIKSRIESLYRKEAELQRGIRKEVKEPHGMVKVMDRISHECKLKKLREEIEEEEFHLYEARIIKSLRTR